MHDTLNYLKSDFPYREQNHNMLTFSMSYAEAENYVLSLSHDEVVHGKASIINKMPGDYDEKFAQIKTLLVYQLTRTGAALNFMGNELPEFIEWRYYEGLEWFLLDIDKHKKHHEFVKMMNHLYLKEKSFYEKDQVVWEGFNWIDAGNAKQHIFIYERIALDPDDRCIVILNFGKDEIENFKLGVNVAGKYEEIVNSNELKWGGTGTCLNDKVIESIAVEEDEDDNKDAKQIENDTEKELDKNSKKVHGKDNYIEVKIPKLSAVILKLKSRAKEKPKAIKKSVRSRKKT